MPLPIPGSVAPGQLLIDAQSRQLWFGVPDTVDINLSILVGDIVALMAEDADIRVDTAAALTAGLATKAPLVHTHTAAQITDFTAAVNAIVGAPGGGAGGVPAGCIIMYSGALPNVGVGALAGFVLCDGSNGTPNLVDKFVRGAGNIAVGATGGSSSVAGTTDGGGAHNHTAVTGAAVLTVAQLPAHNHGVTDPGHVHGGSTDTKGAHTHTTDAWNNGPAGSGISVSGTGSGIVRQSAITSSSKGDHSHALTVDNHTTGISTNNAGSGEGHSHAINTEAAHVHTFNVANANLPPWVALAFIMKLP